MLSPVFEHELQLILLVCVVFACSPSSGARLKRQIKGPVPYSWYTAQNGKMLSMTFPDAFKNLGKKVLTPRLASAAHSLNDHTEELEVIVDFRQELTTCVRKLERYFQISVDENEVKRRCAAPNDALMHLSEVQPECSKDMLEYFLKNTLPTPCESFMEFVGEEDITYASVVSWLFGDPGTCYDESSIVVDVLGIPCGIVESNLIRKAMDQVQADVMTYVVSMTKRLPEDASGCHFDWIDDYDFKSEGRHASFVPTACAFHLDPEVRCDAESTNGPLHTFRVGSLLGAGSFATTWKIRDNTDEKEYALRVSIASIGAAQHVMSTTDPITAEAFLTETARFGSLQLVQCYAARLDSGQSLGFQLLELADGDLSQFLGALLADKVALAKAIESLLQQLVRLHSVLHLSHNDLKPQNILYKEAWPSLVKIADYDTVTDAEASGQTLLYRPPDDDGSAGGTRDMFAAGLTIYEMLKGEADQSAEDEQFADCFQKSTLQEFSSCSLTFFSKRLQLDEVPSKPNALALHKFKTAVLTDVVIPCMAPVRWRDTADKALQAFASLSA